MANAGRVAIVPKGEYSATVAYKRLDLVRYNNDLYIAKKANTGVTPTDSETWMLSLENVSQTQYDDIISGTQLVGKAKDSEKLNGLTADEFRQKTKKTINTLPTPTEECDYFVSGADSTFPYTFGELEIRYGSYIMEWTAIFKSTGNDKRVYYNFYHNTLGWVGWRDISDGGNANTVDGLHASDFQNKNDRREITSLIDSVTTPTDIRALMWQFPSGHYTWASSFNRNVIMPFVNDTGMHVNWERKHQDDNNMYYGILTITSMVDNSQWETCSIFNNTQYTEWQSFLPLNGSVPMSGNLRVATGYGLVASDILLASLTACNTQDDYANCRSLIVYNSLTDDKGGVAIRHTRNGVTTENTVLHTGNSQKVVTSTSAPTDTSALWVDTANKVSKIYIDGAWTALA